MVFVFIVGVCRSYNFFFFNESMVSFSWIKDFQLDLICSFFIEYKTKEQKKRDQNLSKDIVIGPFNYSEKSSYFRIVIERFCGKSALRGSVVVLQFFWSLREAI